MCNDCDKLTPSVGTPTAATPPKDAIFGAGEPRDATGHDIGKQMPSVSTPSKDVIFTSDPGDVIGREV
jgi:hypothetical protein